MFKKQSTKTNIEITIGNDLIRESNSVNVLGVTFDVHLTWSSQIEKTITEAKTQAHGLKYLAKFFTDVEMLKILTVYVFAKFNYHNVI